MIDTNGKPPDTPICGVIQNEVEKLRMQWLEGCITITEYILRLAVLCAENDAAIAQEDIALSGWYRAQPSSLS